LLCKSCSDKKPENSPGLEYVEFEENKHMTDAFFRTRQRGKRDARIIFPGTTKSVRIRLVSEACFGE
jgi:hypothetical protein